MIRKFLSSDLAAERLQSRDNRFSLFDGRLLDAAGFLVDSDLFKELKSFDEIVKAGHAIIVAEGGMGKSYVLQQFCKSQQDQSLITCLDLVRCANDFQALKNAIADASQNKEYLFLDGLNEAVKFAGDLSRILQDIGERVHVVITSRGIPQLNLLSDQLQWPMFTLLPYSRENVRELCDADNVDFDTFMRTIERQNIGGICSKPLGCKMLISEYRTSALKDYSTENLWRTSLKNLCAENPESETLEYVQDSPSILVEEGIRIATIAALALKLSGHAFLSRISDKPPKAGCIDSAQLFSNRDAFNALLLRSLFSYVDKDCYRFAHSSYEDFLAAQGLMKYLDEKEWARIVFSPEGLPYPQWECAIPWLAACNDDVLEKTKRSRPDLLLGTDALVNKLGEEEICKAILEHADHVSSSVRENPAVQSRYYALNSEKCAKVIRRILRNTTSGAIVDTAIDIVRRARLAKVSDVLVDMFCDKNCDSTIRIKAGSALIELANKTQRKKCKMVLQEPMVYRLKGLVARMTWPDVMSVEELISLLTSKQCVKGGGLSIWLEHGGFVASLSRLTSKAKFQLLEWAVSKIQIATKCKFNPEESVTSDNQGYDDSDGSIADALRAVFLHCWKEERSKKFVALLAKGMVAYGSIGQSPFSNDNYSWHDSNHIFSTQAFRNDSIRRREVAKFIVENPQLPIDASYNCWIGLLQPDDGNYVVESLQATTQPLIRERWANCLRYLGYICLPEMAALWNQMHREFPAVFSCNAAEALSAGRKAEKELAAKQHRFAREREKREKKRTCILSRNVIWAHKVLQCGGAKGKFVPLANVLNQQMPPETEVSYLDLRTSMIWTAFSENERRNLVEAAYDFLLKSKGPWSDVHTVYPIYTQALCLLFTCDKDLLNKLPLRAWKKLAPELLHYLFSKFDLVSETVAHFKKMHRKTFLEIFSKYLKEQFLSDAVWEINDERTFLDEKELLGLLRFLDVEGISDHLKSILYARFMEADHTLVEKYLKKKYASIPLRDSGLRTLGYVLLSAPHRFQEFMRELTSDPVWGVSWAESALPQEEYHQGPIMRLLPILSVANLKDFYSWLHVQFPPEKAPDYKIGFRSNDRESLYVFKSRVFNILMSRIDPETVCAIEELQQQFPQEHWFHDYALQLRNQLLATEYPTFSMGAICKLLESKKCMRVIHNANDLLQVIMESLGRYQTSLTGVNNPLVRFLWHEHKGYTSHRSEKDFSNHIQAFFSADLRKMFSNREVQLNCGRKGQTGARTDILINASAEEVAVPLSLCIEVKGSWNPEVKTAYKTQLVDKYMDVGGADAGIFLVGWFESEQEEKKTCIDKKENIEKMLEVQEQELVGQGHKVKHLIVDCSYSLPSRPAKKSRNAKRKKE